MLDNERLTDVRKLDNGVKISDVDTCASDCGNIRCLQYLKGDGLEDTILIRGAIKEYEIDMISGTKNMKLLRCIDADGEVRELVAKEVLGVYKPGRIERALLLFFHNFFEYMYMKNDIVIKDIGKVDSMGKKGIL